MFVITFFVVLLVVIASSVARACQLLARHHRSAREFMTDMEHYAARSDRRASSLSSD